MKAFFHSILTAALLFAVPAAVADELPTAYGSAPSTRSRRSSSRARATKPTSASFR